MASGLGPIRASGAGLVCGCHLCGRKGQVTPSHPQHRTVMKPQPRIHYEVCKSFRDGFGAAVVRPEGVFEGGLSGQFPTLWTLQFSCGDHHARRDCRPETCSEG